MKFVFLVEAFVVVAGAAAAFFGGVESRHRLVAIGAVLWFGVDIAIGLMFGDGLMETAYKLAPQGGVLGTAAGLFLAAMFLLVAYAALNLIQETKLNHQETKKTYVNSVNKSPVEWWNEGLALYIEGRHRDALYAWRRASDSGSARAMRSIGYLYEEGNGVTQDYGEAIYWYRKAADSGDTEAMNNIGYLYDKGRGVAKDHNEAMGWYRQGANGGCTGAMNNIGDLYDKGRGIVRDPCMAAKWLMRALWGGEELTYEGLHDNPNDYQTDTREALQQELYALGAYSGPINGEMDAATLAAIDQIFGVATN